MTRYSKFNIIYLLQKWMDSVPGQTFLNYAYSWGASIVILGTLFKLTHIPGANLMLFIGMGTEVVMEEKTTLQPFQKETGNMPERETFFQGMKTWRTRMALRGSQDMWPPRMAVAAV